MRSLSALLFLCFTVTTVLAVGNGESSTGIQRYDGDYNVNPRIGNRGELQRYTKQLQDFLFEKHPEPDFSIQTLSESPFTHDQLKTDLDHDRNLRRFLFLGHTKPGAPDMVLAAPLAQTPRPDGTRKFVLLTAQKPHKIKVKGYVEIQRPEKVMDVIRGSHWPDGYALERGHVLNMDEIFEQLSMLQPPSWKGKVPLR